MTLANTNLSGNKSFYGSGIYNDGTSTITGGNISDNTVYVGVGYASSGRGGGIFNKDTLTVTGCVVTGNTATPNNSAEGGGIENEGTLALNNSSINGNSATFTGGGVENAGTLTATESTISGNTASIEGGGGIDNESNDSVTLTGCTLSNNTAPIGGGMQNHASSGPVEFIDSTISGNAATGNAAITDVGGGIDNFSSKNSRLSTAPSRATRHCSQGAASRTQPAG